MHISRRSATLSVRTLSRRGALRGGAAGLAMPFLPRLAGAAEVEWRVAHGAPSAFPIHARLLEAASAITARTGGKIEVRVVPNGELGSPIGLLAQVRAGKLDATLLSHQVLSGDLQVAAAPSVGFAFPGYDRLWEAMDGDLGSLLRQQLRERLGLFTPKRCWDFGFRQLTTASKRIETAADLVGVRIRTPPEASLLALFRALNAVPLGMPLEALDRSLRSHVVEGQEGMMPLVDVAQLYEVQSACALTNHVWDGQWVCISAASWNKLAPSLRDVVIAALDESGLRQRQDVASNEARVRTSLEARGMRFNAVDLPSFRATLQKSDYYTGARVKLGDSAWAVLEKYSGKLA